jgi:DNA-binding transcriptional MerR regulator
MPYHALSTLKIARAAGCHPNTVRLYETWGFLPPVPRSAAGYRLYTQEHLDQIIFARTAFHTGWPGRAIRRSVTALVRKAAGAHRSTALADARRHLLLVQSEMAYAEEAASLLEGWAHSPPAPDARPPLTIRAAAKAVGATPDMLRGWERDGMLCVPLNPRNHYREYGAPELARLRIIRLLRSAGYNTMGILRMLLQLDSGRGQDLRAALDTPRADEDVYFAADRWLTTLRAEEEIARKLICLLEARARD